MFEAILIKFICQSYFKWGNDEAFLIVNIVGMIV